MRTSIVTPSAISLVFAAACGAGYPPPNDALAVADKSIGRAEQAGSMSVPDAKLHLELAREDFAKAKGLIGNDNQRSGTLVERANAEAQLAVALAQAQKAQDASRDAAQRLAAVGGK